VSISGVTDVGVVSQSLVTYAARL